MYLSGKEDRHEQGLGEGREEGEGGVLVHKVIVKIVKGYRQNFKQTHDSAAESKHFRQYHNSGICINIHHDDSEDEFYIELQCYLINHQNQDILVVQVDWNAKVREE